MPTAEAKPSWRKIEAALAELLPRYGYHITEDHGDRYVDNDVGDPVALEALARDLEDRL